jgi:hypothetical protein
MNKEKNGRGRLTERVQDRAKELMQREITTTELRLMPYIQYVMVNEQRLDPAKLKGEERPILR